MTQEDLLYTLAELSVAFAGFSGIVVAISKSNTTGEGPPNSLVSMIFLALIVAGFALLPTVISVYEVSNDLRWRLCNGLLSVAAVVYFTNAYLRVRRVIGAGPLFFGWKRAAYRVLALATAVAYLVVALVNALAAAGAMGASVAVYLTSLYVLLVIAGIFFVVAFLRISQTEGQGDSNPGL